MARSLQGVVSARTEWHTVMNPLDNNLPESTGFSVSGHPDPYTAGEAVLDRAKSVAQRITERVRDLTGTGTSETKPGHCSPPADTDTLADADPTGEHTPLPE